MAILIFTARSLLQNAGEHRDALFGEGVWQTVDVRPRFDIPNWNFKFAPLQRKLEHEIRRETIRVSFHCVVQMSSGHAVERCQIRIEHHLLFAKNENRLRNPLDWNDLFAHSLISQLNSRAI